MRLSTSMDLSDGVQAGGGGVAPFVNTKSLDFDGVDDYVDCGSITGGSGDISVSLWIKTSSASWYDLEFPIVMYSSLGSGTAIGRTYGQGANRVISIGYSNGSTKLNDGNWHHLVWTREISSGNMAGYVDGNPTPEVTSTSVGTYVYNFRIGAYTNSIGTASLWFDGLVDEVSYWNSVLTTGEISTIYNSGTPIDLTSLNPISWWRMGDGDSFPTLTDHGSAGSDGTMTNMVAGDIVEDVPA
tara:strand:- start:1275 stop:2000 length:726 start_codon:yes stop_codon:yes gene_type:complete